MLVIPAIDLLGGRVVRLLQGDYQRVLDSDLEAVALAADYARQGAPWLHVIDLDGARSGRWRNLDIIGQICRQAAIPVQAGGGARNRHEVQLALDAGASRVIVSTLALRDETALQGLINDFGERIAVSLDARQGRLMVEGWTADTGMDTWTAAKHLVDCGVKRLIHTDVGRDGMLAGVGLRSLIPLMDLGVPVMVAGGVGSRSDILDVRHAGAEAAIVGRALLEGRIQLAEAIAAAS